MKRLRLIELFQVCPPVDEAETVLASGLREPRHELQVSEHTASERVRSSKRLFGPFKPAYGRKVVSFDNLVVKQDRCIDLLHNSVGRIASKLLGELLTRERMLAQRWQSRDLDHRKLCKNVIVLGEQFWSLCYDRCRRQ